MMLLLLLRGLSKGRETTLSPNMGSLVSILQDELRANCKELKKSAAAVSEKEVGVTQPSAGPLAAAVVENQYLAHPSGMHAPQRDCKCF